MAGPYHTPSGANKKVGSRPLIRSTRFRANLEYIPAARQKQDTVAHPATRADCHLPSQFGDRVFYSRAAHNVRKCFYGKNL